MFVVCMYLFQRTITSVAIRWITNLKATRRAQTKAKAKCKQSHNVNKIVNKLLDPPSDSDLHRNIAKENYT